MLKTIDIILVALMISAAAWTFGVKHQAETLEHEVRVLDRKIALERETIALLEADWSLLNQPVRLQRLADAFAAELALQPLQPQQIVEPDELPAPPVPKLPDPSDAANPRTASIESSAR